MKATPILAATAATLMLGTGVAAAAMDAPATAAAVKDDPACSPRAQIGDVMQKPARLFAKLDRDGNGTVSQEEYVLTCLPAITDRNTKGYRKDMVRQQFASFDADRDGRVTLEEYDSTAF